ncbi:MAG: hypothetical protein K9K65_06020 [Desulfarculaceae bacterium]|nr:hypothetical protein [Desulfarculaceae bacterium]MCF8064339.1 hypothetical protein [Desulfarculaceae bacterium]MCF8097382.1 hypothetical protein [Desulfarculaceae bacterium]MCF8123806.1 hypothetical protein [Desulfarculaceae bacterium]
MNDAVERYADGLAEGLAPELLEPEAVSRKAIFREQIAEDWDQLNEQERELVSQADRALLEMAEEVAGFWREDMISDIREREKIPESHWWWWLDRIADGDYPQEHLPETA